MPIASTTSPVFWVTSIDQPIMRLEHASRGAERDALADEARTLARDGLNSLRERGYPGLQLVTILSHNAFTMQTKQRHVPAWKISRSGIDAENEAEEAACRLSADGEFAVGAQDGVVHKRRPEELLLSGHPPAEQGQAGSLHPEGGQEFGPF